MSERYEQVDGPPGSAIFNKWLTSGDFPDYDTNVTLEIANVMKGFQLKLPGGVTKDEGIVAFFAPTRTGKPPKQLLLNKGHQKALVAMFGKTMGNWRGHVNLFVTKQSIKVTGTLHDQVKMKDRVPAIRAKAPLNEEPNEGGGVGKLGKPKEKEKEGSPALKSFKAMGKEVKKADGIFVDDPLKSFPKTDKMPDVEPSLIPELCGKDHPNHAEECDLLPSHDGVCSWARDPATGDPLPDHLV